MEFITYELNKWNLALTLKWNDKKMVYLLDSEDEIKDYVMQFVDEFKIDKDFVLLKIGG